VTTVGPVRVVTYLATVSTVALLVAGSLVAQTHTTIAIKAGRLIDPHTGRSRPIKRFLSRRFDHLEFRLRRRHTPFGLLLKRV
jgi:hypothetical protein